nr:transketolase [Gammaproteobacteria bacterium]
MRNAFADELTKLAAADPRVVLLSGDIGNRLFDKLKAAAPDRFFNCG